VNVRPTRQDDDEDFDDAPGTFGGMVAIIRHSHCSETTLVIKAVVFDIDGVLCHYRIEHRLALLASWSGRSPDAIHAAIWRSGFEDEAERGVISADDYLKGFGERMGYPLSAAQWVEARRVAIEPDLAVLALARQLSVDCPVGMFTNNPWLLKRHIAEVFPAVPGIFGPRAIFSAELGRRKPDPEAFRRLATRLEVAPDEMHYLDDDAAYVAGARQAGLSADRVGGAAAVRASLAVHGLGAGKHRG
jgi:HAD superfamily hydrolase (TIGR01509 family)